MVGRRVFFAAEGKGGLSEAGFAGFWEIFGIAGERLMVGRRVFFAAEGKGGLSEAGFAGFWEIFGIAGERLMVGRRIPFVAGERADCLKQDLQDFGGFSGLRANG